MIQMQDFICFFLAALLSYTTCTFGHSKFLATSFHFCFNQR